MSDHSDIAAKLRSAMRRLPGPVTLITTHDSALGEAVGMVASAVIPVSMEPPSMMVAVNRNAQCHGAITAAGRFCINLLGTDSRDLVTPFSTPSLRAERFTEGGWEYDDSIPFLPSALANLFCKVEASIVHGSHEMFIGNCYDVRSSAGDMGEPLGWKEGGFARFEGL